MRSLLGLLLPLLILIAPARADEADTKAVRALIARVDHLEGQRKFAEYYALWTQEGQRQLMCSALHGLGRKREDWGGKVERLLAKHGARDANAYIERLHAPQTRNAPALYQALINHYLARHRGKPWRYVHGRVAQLQVDGDQATALLQRPRVSGQLKLELRRVGGQWRPHLRHRPTGFPEPLPGGAGFSPIVVVIAAIGGVLVLVALFRGGRSRSRDVMAFPGD